MLNTTIKQKKTGGFIVTPLHYKDALSNADTAAGQWTRMAGSHQQENSNNSGQDKHERWIVGFASGKNKYFEASQHTFPPLVEVQNASNMLEQWSHSGDSLAKNLQNRLKKMETAPRRQHNDIAGTIASMRPYIEHELSVRIDELLAGGSEAWQEAAATWDPLLKAAAKSLAPGFTTAALERQRVIMNARPVINPAPPHGNETLQPKKQGGEE